MENTPKSRQQWIFDELKLSPLCSYSVMFGHYSGKFGKSDKTFDKDWKQAVLTHNEYRKKLNNAKDKASIGEEIKALKNGLKTKFERLMTLQKQIDNCEIELELNKTSDIMFKDGEVIPFDRALKPLEKSHLRKTIKELQSEISKIEGDYEKDNLQKKNEVKTTIKWGNNEISV